MQTLEAIMTRRSNRKFKNMPIAQEQLNTIIEAGRYAPCGGNSQTTHFLVITNTQILTELAQLVQEEFAKMETTPGMYKSLAAAITRSKAHAFTFHYGAPCLIVVANKKGYSNAMADCACAVENMLLAANDMDLGSCYINQLHWLDENTRVRSYMEKLGLGTDETICASLVIGHADTQDGLPPRQQRKITGNPISIIE